MHVLIVEDEPEMAQLLAKGLREEKFEISLARDGTRRSRSPQIPHSMSFCST